MTEQSPLRIGVRVDDVSAAIRFYGGFGFETAGSVPGPDGEPVFAILRKAGSQLMVDALVGMPFPDTERERHVRAGPRGLGVVIGLVVDDVDGTHTYCVQQGCAITCEPMDEAWGDRVFTCLDPFGYEWEFLQPIADVDTADGLAAVRESWFGAPA
jgi:uncharacterized glyoxalase superfamily protein PhnB